MKQPISVIDIAILNLILLFFLKIVVFVLGYLTVRLGFNLITSGAKGEFQFKTELGGFHADLASLSPGLLFVLLGVMLIGYAVYVDKRIEVNMAPAGTASPSGSQIPDAPDAPNPK